MIVEYQPKLKKSESLVVGKKYFVASIFYHNTMGVSFRIIFENGKNNYPTLAVVPADDFRIVDGKLPANFIACNFDDCIRILPKSWAYPEFIENYHDMEPEALRLYTEEEIYLKC